ncbi:uncharacterized protein LOC124171707 isoform X1 [Ischnura elegans]|uniref:uncharacterized protein LOC124171707 isoform X1 n=1 Tax=Ischnura elegans TaxID=197161 RepID=UPI001ED89878|nr:uncharacterized protein LOC124171707 isoform X1 [Ischnura elegans]XP_046406925.1 uncharacterized protein LOC124171707 isoform X1 [Ischnura elegans]
MKKTDICKQLCGDLTHCIKYKYIFYSTLTYGLKCSPLIANRALKQLAKDEAANFPLGSIALDKETYMDGVLSGDHEIHTALAKQKEVINLCMVGGFSLRKWHSNSSTLLQWLPQELLASEPKSLFANDSSFVVLGLNWQPSEDCFNFDVKIDQKVEQWTKRLVLSKVAKLFDPLGWIAPVIITAKIFLQKLWLLKIDWNEPLPRTEAEQWETFYSYLPQITSIKVPRWLGYSATMNVIQLHGFADASKSTYGAVLYLRTSNKSAEKSFRVRMIQAKTRVAPLKTISIPRLELSAAHLLAKLTNHHTKRFESELLKIHLWTDSQDVLCWLKEHPSRWPTFVANRCSDIHTLVPTANWRHIGTKNNPADLASRGCLASALNNQNLWWSGSDYTENSYCFINKYCNN